MWPYGVIGDSTTVNGDNLTALADRTYNSRPNMDANDWSFDAVDAARLDMGSQVSSDLVANTEKYQTYISGLAAYDSTPDEPYIEQPRPSRPRWMRRWPPTTTGRCGLPRRGRRAGTARARCTSRAGPRWTCRWRAAPSPRPRSRPAPPQTMTVRNPWPGQQAEVVNGSSGAVVVGADHRVDVQRPGHGRLLLPGRTGVVTDHVAAVRAGHRVPGDHRQAPGRRVDRPERQRPPAGRRRPGGPVRRDRGGGPGHGAGGQLRHRRAGGGVQRHLGQRQRHQLPLRRRRPGGQHRHRGGRCGDDLGWTATGQWFKYTVNVATAGTYTVSLRLASPSGVTDGLHIANSSGANLSGNINVPTTGGWQTWTTVTATVTLPAGQQTLTVDQDNGGWNIRQLTFASSSGAPYGGTAAAVPGTVQAANYDTGGQGVAYNVTSVNGTGNSYRSDGVDLEACSDTGGGDDLGWTATGQWFNYTVNVATARSYTVTCGWPRPRRDRRPAHRQLVRGQLVREHQRPGHRRLADLDHGHGDGHLARRAADPDHRPGQRRLEHPPAHLRRASEDHRLRLFAAGECLSARGTSPRGVRCRVKRQRDIEHHRVGPGDAA